MDSSRWNEITEIFAGALEIADAKLRREFVAQKAADTTLRGEVEALLASWENSESLESPALAETALAGVGEHVGPYRVIREIGRGGMGIVFQAERADGQFQRQVALKFIGGPLWSDLQRRFQRERQILASLQHPNIIRLLDAGISKAGLPYLVMDYVEGVPVTEYCRQRNVPLHARLKLFRTICEAVHHAHQRLVLHRDLKPGNILVDEGGNARLLDFGISRLLEESSGEDTTGQLRLTPNYASPEQIRGESLSTASDVYSLGVILHCMVTDENPYDLSQCGVAEVIRRISDTTIRPPSEVAGAERGKQLVGDVDAIVMKAMSPEAAKRYASAEEFARDIERYLDRQPVIARAPSWTYRTSKFLRRHSLAVSITSLSALLLVVATGVALYQERKVRQERERTVAQLNSVRDLANSLLYDYQESLAAIPGTLEVRKKMIGRALEHLERLTKYAKSAELRLNVAEAWWRLGQVQGGLEWGLGDRKAAMSSYRQARGLLEAILKEQPDSVQASRQWIEWSLEMAQLAHFAGWKEEEANLCKEYRPRLSSLVRLYPNDEDFIKLAASDEFELGLVDDLSKSLPHWLKSLEGFERLLLKKPDDAKRIYNVSILSKRVAANYSSLQQLDQALIHAKRALELERRQIEKRSGDRHLRLDFTYTLSTLASIYIQKKEFRQGLDLMGQAIAIRRELMRADPLNERVSGSLTGGLAFYGQDLQLANDPVSAIPVFRECLKMIDTNPRLDPEDHIIRKMASDGLASAQRQLKKH